MRKIDAKLLKRLTEGDLLPLLNYIKADNELRLEVRSKGEAFVYYRKGKALEIGNLKVDKKYGNVPPTELAVSNPSEYFKKIKQSIDNWLGRNKNRAEFDTQQNIARFNQSKDNKYIIIDMEYAFEQKMIKKDERVKKAVFDLLGIDQESGQIVFFEVKKGMNATKGKSGIDDHIKDFNTFIKGKNSAYFKENLFQDVENIILDKQKLGLLSDFKIPRNLRKHIPGLIFVFHPDNDSEIQRFKIELKNRTRLILVSNNNYKLNLKQ